MLDTRELLAAPQMTDPDRTRFMLLSSSQPLTSPRYCPRPSAPVPSAPAC
jgi:hypothetical protein